MMWVVVETWSFCAWGPFHTRGEAVAFAHRKNEADLSRYFEVRKLRGGVMVGN